ncbi:MAG: diacylglycerol kinase family protein [Patescibacteria group bacterium]
MLSPSLKRLINSFRHAWHGLLQVFKDEHSFRIQVFAALLVGIFAFLFPLERWERALLVLAIGAVLVLELINSIIERFVDIIKPRVHEYARQLKDISAAAVLVMACTAVILAIIIFWPHIYLLVRI